MQFVRGGILLQSNMHVNKRYMTDEISSYIGYECWRQSQIFPKLEYFCISCVLMTDLQIIQNQKLIITKCIKMLSKVIGTNKLWISRHLTISKFRPHKEKILVSRLKIEKVMRACDFYFHFLRFLQGQIEIFQARIISHFQHIMWNVFL